MLPPPEIQQALDDIVVETRRMLRKFYLENGMTSTPPVSVTTRQRGSLVFHASPQLLEEEKKRAEMEKRVIPPGVNFTEKPRIPGELRDRYLDHLREMCAEEYIDVTEAGARIDAAMIAKTEEELRFLIHDLPALAEKKDVIELAAGSKKEPATFADAVEYLAYALVASVWWMVTTPAISAFGRIVFLITGVVAVYMWTHFVSNLSAWRKNKKKE